MMLLVLLGGAVGAPVRYLVDRFVQRRHDSPLPWGTLTVNVVGSALLGALAGAGTAVSGSVLALVGTGFCGALTTYSTFGYEVFRLVEARALRYAVVNVAANVVAGVGAAVLAHTVVGAIT